MVEQIVEPEPVDWDRYWDTVRIEAGIAGAGVNWSGHEIDSHREYKALFPRLQSKKGKDNALSTSQNVDLGAMLQNGKVLDTHSAQTEFGLLDSKWPFIYPYKWYMTLQWHIEIPKFNINSLFKNSKFKIFI